jgi:hypothetical protein
VNATTGTVFKVGRVLLRAGLGLMVLLLSVCIVLLAWLYWSGRPPSSGQLEAVFYGHRSDLETLADMIKADGNDGFCLEGANLAQAKAALPAARMATYRATMARAGIACVAQDSDGTVWETAWSFGFPGTQTARGFRRGSVCSKRVVSCIDEPACYPADRKPHEVFVRALTNEWMIFAW